jgi:hypothetical protein
MEAIIEQLFSKGDFYLKEAKVNFFMKKEDQGDAICNCCNALRMYFEAYEKFLFVKVKPSENYHVLLHVIFQKDPDFKKFHEKIFEVKCFAEESKRKGEEFFLYADEMNDVLKIVLDVRRYIAEKINLGHKFLSEFTGTSFMAI